ncbi:MAG: hypothetical protein HQL06_01325 [Nitrospirae bacterium]|nr:hypothetical protein [Nitrospirota bacterium]
MLVKSHKIERDLTVVSRDLMAALRDKQRQLITSKAIVTLLTSAFLFCGVFAFNVHAGSVAALRTYEKGVDALQEGNCNRSVVYFKKAVEIDPVDKTLRIGMFDFVYAPNTKLKDSEKRCTSPGGSPLNLPARQSATDPLVLPTPPPTTPSDRTQQGVVLKKELPAGREQPVKGTFDGNLGITLDGQSLTIEKDGSFSAVLTLKHGKDSILLEAQRGAAKEKSLNPLLPTPPAPEVATKSLSVSLPLTTLGLSAETAAKLNHTHGTLSVSGDVTYAGIERSEVLVTINKAVLSLGTDINIESHLPISVRLRF